MTQQQKIKSYFLSHGAITVRECETNLQINSPYGLIKKALAGLSVREGQDINKKTGAVYKRWRVKG
jgi:hypothetical protein